MSKLCRNCSRETALENEFGLGPKCLKKLGFNPEIVKIPAAKPIQVSKIDLSQIRNTYAVHVDTEESPLDLAAHYAFEQAGYDDFDREDVEKIFDTTVKTLFNGDRIPDEFKNKLNAMGFEIKGFLPRMRCVPGNLINLIVGTKDGNLDMVLRINANFDRGLIFFRTNPQYTLLNPDRDDLYISMRDEVNGDNSEGVVDFSFFMAKIGKPPHREYIENFPQWVEENCLSVNLHEKKNLFSTANPTAAKQRGNPKMDKHKKELTLDQLKSSAYMSPEEREISPLRINVIKHVLKEAGDISKSENLLKAIQQVEIDTFDIYATKLGRIFGHSSQGNALWESISDVEKPIPEGINNNHVTRIMSTAIELCRAKGFSEEKTSKVVPELFRKYFKDR